MTTTGVLDALVIGAGQAGLAFGYHLKQTRRRFLLVDKHERIGDSWRQRFDSLTLFTPAAHSALPGLPVPGDPEAYPTKNEIADYLESYARHFELPVALNVGIDRLERRDELFTATATDGTVLTARAVIIATGAFQQPAIPPLSQQFDGDVVQLTAETYRNPHETPAGTVLVVGDGATGRQIARELSGTHRALLSTGRRRRVSPERILGKSIFWWMERLGILRASRESRIGHFLKRTDPFPGKNLDLQRLRERGIQVVGRLSAVAGHRVSFIDGTAVEIDVVVWATGYRDRSDWVAIPAVKDEHGAFVEHRGVSVMPNLYFIGRNWQTTRGSALLTGVGADAAEVARHLTQSLSGVERPRDRTDAANVVPASVKWGSTSSTD